MPRISVLFRTKNYGFNTVLLVLLAVGGALFFDALEKQSELVPEVPIGQREEKKDPLTTMYRNRDVYERAFSQAAEASFEKVSAEALIAPHHFLAAPFIARSYAAVADDSIRRIILVSPDHYQLDFQGSALAITTDSSWDGLFRDVSPDKQHINQLLERYPEIRNARTPFLREHGIYTEIPFIAHYFPDAQIVPLILKNTYDYADFAALGRALAVSADATETMLVISSDFSHHATHTSVQEADRRSIRVLENLSDGDFDELQNDCRACIALMSGYLGFSGDMPIFHLVDRGDSTDFGGEDADVTSYVSGYLTSSSRVSEQRPFRILFGGDMMFDRFIRTRAERFGNDRIFSGLTEELSAADLVVANLEGPITSHSSVSETSDIGTRENYIFTFDPSWAETLKKNHIAVVNIGNNHSMNFGEDGVVQTKTYLEKADVDYFGSPLRGDDRISMQSFNGLKVALVNYNQFMESGKERALEDIKTARSQADTVILYAHWGKEYIAATDPVKELAHQFINAGADAIIGSHPHIVQEKEVYEGKVIYYSLGNLIFDQYQRPETQKGLLVEVAIDPITKNLDFRERNIVLKTDGRTLLEY